MSIIEAACTDEAHQNMSDLAAAAYPDEGCGVLIGRLHEQRAEIVAATHARNLNTERSRDRYVLDPDDFLRAERDARASGLDVLGFWHSHPDHPAHPSQYDTDHAWVDYVYVICKTTAEGTADINAFTLDGEGGDFEHLLLIVAPREPSPAP
jgi:proteasome lid subunit RPN8/RPN11